MHDCLNILEDKDQAHWALQGPALRSSLVPITAGACDVYLALQSFILDFKSIYLWKFLTLSYELELKCPMKGFPGPAPTWKKLGSHHIHLYHEKRLNLLKDNLLKDWKTLATLGPIRELRSAEQSTQGHMESLFRVCLSQTGRKN